MFVYGKWSSPFIIWPLRWLSLRADVRRIRAFCEAFGFGYNPAVTPRFPLGQMFRRLGPLDVLGVGRITYEGLTTTYLWEHSLEEVRQWFAEAGVELISSSRNVTASGRLVAATARED